MFWGGNTRFKRSEAESLEHDTLLDSCPTLSFISYRCLDIQPPPRGEFRAMMFLHSLIEVVGPTALERCRCYSFGWAERITTLEATDGRASHITKDTRPFSSQSTVKNLQVALLGSARYLPHRNSDYFTPGRIQKPSRITRGPYPNSRLGLKSTEDGEEPHPQRGAKPVHNFQAQMTSLKSISNREGDDCARRGRFERIISIMKPKTSQEQVTSRMNISSRERDGCTLRDVRTCGIRKKLGVIGAKARFGAEILPGRIITATCPKIYPSAKLKDLKYRQGSEASVSRHNNKRNNTRPRSTHQHPVTPSAKP
ncbi:uncharacterized protein BDR25DRAFT_354566 [Lindgomyces ingoldianus]|uniref:Uncharacterized protein n=1 Tax=Lindgomyces ingoldianus TaxID=673940 RepID=A0ACB6QXM5_9PLEO|nr:uncharacterized protein BDR25DRAFT_354566 [Lindgomyces ingoldianus]KAF2471323.1 hypothetical protein BDR25DRAFT_354566 [Lindgomyces ingoldianus]